MSKNRKPKTVAAGLTALLLAGCAGSFMPSTVAQTGSLGANPTSTSSPLGLTEQSVGAHPTAPTEDASPKATATPKPTATPLQKKADSIGPHPTTPTLDATPKPTATPHGAASAALRKNHSLSKPNSVGAHPTGTAQETAAPKASPAPSAV